MDREDIPAAIPTEREWLLDPRRYAHGIVGPLECSQSQSSVCGESFLLAGFQEC